MIRFTGDVLTGWLTGAPPSGRQVAWLYG